MASQKILSEVNYILNNLSTVRDVVDRVYKIRGQLITLCLAGDITEAEFYQISSALSPQSRSPLWQNYFAKKNNCQKVPATDDRGDFIYSGVHHEFKASGYNRDGSVNIVQIRLWQKCDYIIQAISDTQTYTFKLTHSQMKKEVKKLNATSAHGTQAAIKHNKKRELRMTLYRDTLDWRRWLKLYKI